jgi:GrpB-like predicted nucleotidyltransferase (UPF0157 family)
LKEVLQEDLLGVEHVGSTAVSGMSAKPTIDIVADIKFDGGFDSVVDKLSSIAYLYTPEAELDTAERKVFRKGPPDMTKPRRFHLHVCPEGCYYWRRIVGFRDYLRTHDQVAADYLALKQRLVAVYRDAPGLYTSGKADFVMGAVRESGVGPE